MPRKRRRQKERTRWHRQLDIPELLSLECGWSPPQSEFERERIARFDGFLTMDDVAEAWAANKDHGALNCHVFNPARPHDFLPGERPWAFWQFDVAVEDRPREGESEERALDRLGLLSDDEKQALRRSAELAFHKPLRPGALTRSTRKLRSFSPTEEATK